MVENNLWHGDPVISPSIFIAAQPPIIAFRAYCQEPSHAVHPSSTKADYNGKRVVSPLKKQLICPHGLGEYATNPQSVQQQGKNTQLDSVEGCFCP